MGPTSALAAVRPTRGSGNLSPSSSVFEGWQYPKSAVQHRPVDRAIKLDVLFALPLQESNLEGLVQAISQPGSRTYRDYESVSWLASHTGASMSDAEVLLDYLKDRGIQGHLDPTASYVEAAISAGQAAKLFNVTYREFHVSADTGSENVLAPVSEPHLPTALDSMVSLVLGSATVLSNAVVQPPPVITKPTTRSLFGSSFGTIGTPGGCPAGTHVTGEDVPLFTPQQYLTAYGVEGLHASDLEGQGQAVAIWAGVPARQSDLATFTRCFGLTTPHLDNIAIGLGTRGSLHFATAHDEVSLDTEMVAAMAPHVSDIDVLDTPNEFSAVGIAQLFDAPLNRALFSGPMPKVVSISFGVCEVGGYGVSYAKYPIAYALDEHLLMDAAANGISVVNSSGDTGSSCNAADPADRSLARLSVQYPTSSPYVTGVGGTLFGLNANTIKGQEVWNDLPLGVGLASGGGQSSVFARPWYQEGLGLTGNGRLMPDVAMEGDTTYAISTFCGTGCRRSGWQAGGGTSAAAQIFAGGLALADEAAAAQSEAPLGLVNPLLYRLGEAHSSALVDITVGNNDVYGLGCCEATSGYNEATGWGSVNFSAFVPAAVGAGSKS
jgi:subtilase family serine protease